MRTSSTRPAASTCPPTSPAKEDGAAGSRPSGVGRCVTTTTCSTPLEGSPSQPPVVSKTWRPGVVVLVGDEAVHRHRHRAVHDRPAHAALLRSGQSCAGDFEASRESSAAAPLPNRANDARSGCPAGALVVGDSPPVPMPDLSAQRGRKRHGLPRHLRLRGRGLPSLHRRSTAGTGEPTVAGVQHAMLTARPGRCTQEEVLLASSPEVRARRATSSDVDADQEHLRAPPCRTDAHPSGSSTASPTPWCAAWLPARWVGAGRWRCSPSPAGAAGAARTCPWGCTGRRAAQHGGGDPGGGPRSGTSCCCTEAPRWRCARPCAVVAAGASGQGAVQARPGPPPA